MEDVNAEGSYVLNSLEMCEGRGARCEVLKGYALTSFSFWHLALRPTPHVLGPCSPVLNLMRGH